jgi:hypothetical protein
MSPPHVVAHSSARATLAQCVHLRERRALTAFLGFFLEGGLYFAWGRLEAVGGFARGVTSSNS